jgi:hypothetical protein
MLPNEMTVDDKLEPEGTLPCVQKPRNCSVWAYLVWLLSVCHAFFSLNAGIKLNFNIVVAIFLFHLINILILWFFCFLVWCFCSQNTCPSVCKHTASANRSQMLWLVKTFVVFMLQIFVVEMRDTFGNIKLWCHAVSPVIVGKYSRF